MKIVFNKDFFKNLSLPHRPRRPIPPPPSSMTPRRAIEIALQDIGEELSYAKEELAELRLRTAKAEKRHSELVNAEQRMARFLDAMECDK